MQTRALRKKLIREALEAWELEEAASYNDGYMEGYRAGINDD